jgi:hypothetical protein
MERAGPGRRRRLIWKECYRRFVVQNSGQKRRRLWVAVMYAGLTGWTIPALAIGAPPLRDAVPAWVFYAGTFSFAVIGALGFLVTVSTSTHVSHGLGASTGRKEGKLDERQRAIWDQACRASYVVVLCILLLSNFYWGFVEPVFDLDKSATSLLSLAIFLLALSLPNAIVAWTEPDPEPEG